VFRERGNGGVQNKGAQGIMNHLNFSFLKTGMLHWFPWWGTVYADKVSIVEQGVAKRIGVGEISSVRCEVKLLTEIGKSYSVVPGLGVFWWSRRSSSPAGKLHHGHLQRGGTFVCPGALGKAWVEKKGSPSRKNRRGALGGRKKIHPRPQSIKETSGIG